MLQHAEERNLLACEGNAMRMPAGTADMCFAIKFVTAAAIKKLVVQQSSGTPSAFRVNLFNRQTCEVLPGSSSSSSPGSSCNANLAKVIPEQIQGVPGEPMELFHPSDGYVFRNQEGSHSDPVRKIYLQIIRADATGVAEFEASIGYIPHF